MTELRVLNVSGEPINEEEWRKGDKLLALKTASFLADRGYRVAISTTDDGCLMLDYSNVINGVLQPTVKIYAGKVVWPRGTDFDLMMAFLGG